VDASIQGASGLVEFNESRFLSTAAAAVKTCLHPPPTCPKTIALVGPTAPQRTRLALMHARSIRNRDFIKSERIGCPRADRDGARRNWRGVSGGDGVQSFRSRTIAVGKPRTDDENEVQRQRAIRQTGGGGEKDSASAESGTRTNDGEMRAHVLRRRRQRIRSRGRY